MNLLLNLIGLAGACVLILGGFLHLFAPAIAHHFLKSAGITSAVVLCALIALCQVFRGTSSILLIVGVIGVSALAYFVREQRLGRYVRREGPRYAERTPVMPQHVSEEDEQ